MTFKKYIHSPLVRKTRNGVIISTSNWSGPNDLGFYFRYVEIHNSKHAKLWSISESLHFTIDNNNYVFNLIQLVKDSTDHICLEGLIEYHENNKYIKLKSLNNNYFTFIDLFILI